MKDKTQKTVEALDRVFGKRKGNTWKVGNGFSIIRKGKAFVSLKKGRAK